MLHLNDGSMKNNGLRKKTFVSTIDYRPPSWLWWSSRSFTTSFSRTGGDRPAV